MFEVKRLIFEILTLNTVLITESHEENYGFQKEKNGTPFHFDDMVAFSFTKELHNTINS